MESRGLAFGPFTFDPDSGLLTRDGIELPLPPRVIGVLEVLLRRRRRRRPPSGAHRQRLEGRVRDGHVAGGGRQRPAADVGRRPAVAVVHPDAAPARLPVRRACGGNGENGDTHLFREYAARENGECPRFLPFPSPVSFCPGALRRSARCSRPSPSGRPSGTARRPPLRSPGSRSNRFKAPDSTRARRPWPSHPIPLAPSGRHVTTLVAGSTSAAPIDSTAHCGHRD